MTKVYPGIIHSDNGGYWIEFPDLPGCQTQGDTIEELNDMAQEALDANGTICLISTDPAKYFRDTHAVKKMVSLPA